MDKQAIRVYIMNITPLFAEGTALWTEVFAKVDAVRREKSLKLSEAKARAAGLGAGLLLQKAVGDWQCGNSQPKSAAAEGLVETECTVSEVLSRLDNPIPLTYRYGEKGKPYLEKLPLYFSVSHSGEYVLCAVSEKEIGADIQYKGFGKEEKQEERMEKISRRFFAESEYKALESCQTDTEKRNLFFDLWTKKEALGKLTGEGVAGVLSLSVEQQTKKAGLLWQDVKVPREYAAAVCVRRL